MTKKIKLLAPLALAAALGAAPAFAQATGDAEAGAKVFAKCQTCHVVAAADGTVLAGKKAKTGPNLYGLPGRALGGYEGFAYGDSIKSLGDGGAVWSEDEFVAYVADPAKYLKEKTGEKSAKSKMSFKLAKEEEARNVWAFIASLSPAAEAAPATN
ncbi:MAG: c-type cytochrome [Rhodobacterales bacterium]|nr:c-type cytochrome [Rhodobacterales bacterium]